MSKLVTITKVPPRLVRVTKVEPKRVSVKLARPTVTVETAWNEVEW
jgi:hypothetical protein